MVQHPAIQHQFVVKFETDNDGNIDILSQQIICFGYDIFQQSIDFQMAVPRDVQIESELVDFLERGTLCLGLTDGKGNTCRSLRFTGFDCVMAETRFEYIGVLGEQVAILNVSVDYTHLVCD